jgi:ABC-type transport system substrate-binding protein
VLQRNPNYPGDRPRQSARIVFQENLPEAKAIDLADRGAADLIAASGAGELLAPGGVIDHRSRTSTALARRYRLYEGPIIDYFVFNTRRPLFRDARFRRAVSYALDRRSLAAAFGDAPADRIVSPAVPGYPAGRIFPLSPDFTAARKLAGGRSADATVYVCDDARGRTLAEIVRTNLARIKIAVSVLEDEQCPDNPRSAPKPSRADLLLVSGWPFMESDERDPAPVLDQALAQSVYGTPLPSAGWTERAFRRRLEQARPLHGAARDAAYHRLANEFTRMGPIAVFGTWVWPEYFSPQVGCKVFQGEYGAADLGALCKR